MTGIDPLLLAGGVWLWENYGKDVFGWLVKHLGKGAEELKEVGWERVDWERASRTYREEMKRQCGWMQIFGMNRPVPLADIYTDVYLWDKPRAWRRNAIEELRASAQSMAERLSDKERRNAVELVAASPRLFILGQPGGGKTTFLKYLVTQAIAGKLNAIPIFVSLKAWSDTNIDLIPFLVRQFAICGFPDAQPFVERILEEGKAIILFDGLDEVNLERGARERITMAIGEFVQQYSKSRMVITCRTAATEYMFTGFTYCELADFTQMQIEAFIGRWFQQDEIKHAAFLNAFEQPDNKPLQDLARRPLLLTMLCLTFEETMVFPQRRAELYEEAFDALLKKWDSTRSIQRDIAYHKLSLGYKLQLFTEVAAETFQCGEFFMRKRDLVERVMRFLQRLPPIDVTEDIDGETILHAIEAQHGLLIEQARDVYSFSHLTFHEYFTARYVADHPSWGVLRNMIIHAPDPQWREVLLLAASMLDYRNTALLFRIWCRDLQEQLRDHKPLRLLIESTAHMTHVVKPSSTGIRTTVLMQTMIAQLLIATQKMVPDLTNDLTQNLALSIASANDLSLASIGPRNRDFANSIANSLISAQEVVLDPDFALFMRFHDSASRLTNYLINGLNSANTNSAVCDLANTLNRTLQNTWRIAHDRDLALAVIFLSERASTYIRSETRDRALSQANELASKFHTRNAAIDKIILIAQTTSQICELYFRYHSENLPDATQIAQFVEHDRYWELTLAQLETLQHYMSSTLRLLECLNVAVVEDRETILDQLLLPPDLSDASKPLRL